MSNMRLVKATARSSFERHLGTLVELMIRKGSYTKDMAVEIENVFPAILLEQVFYFYDDYRRVCGFALWALLTPEVEQRIISDQNILLHESEWNEGDRFWIVCFATRFGKTSEIIKALKSHVLPKHGEMRFLRPKGDGRIARIRVVGS